MDRVRGEVVDFEVTQKRDLDSYLPLAMRLEENFDIDIYTSDDCFTYNKYKIAKKHVSTKSETCLVESIQWIDKTLSCTIQP